MSPRYRAMAAAVVLGATVILTLLWLLSVPGLPVAAEAATTASPRYVSPTGIDSGDCTGSASPCRTVQYAVDQADEGSVIKVASGVYTGVQGRSTLTLLGGPETVTQVVYITKSIAIQGGYTTTNGFADPPDPIANPTMLDARRQGRVIYIGGASGVTVTGLYITRGDAIGLAGGQWIDDEGGGVYVVSATAVLSDNHVYGNIARDGGGVYVVNSAVTLRGNHLYSNTAGNAGGGMCVINGDGFSDVGTTVIIIENQVFSNTTDSLGGGIYVNNDTFDTTDVNRLSVDLVDNQVFGNTAGYGGGGIFVGRSYITYGSPTDATLVGNTIYDNRAESRGGGLLLRFLHPTLNRNRFISNTADYGGGVFLAPHSGGTFSNTTIVDNWADTAGSGLYSLTSSPSLLHATVARNRGGDGSGLLISWEEVGDVIPITRVDLVNVIVASQTVGITMTRDITHPWIDTGDTTLDGVLWFANGANIGGIGTISITHAYTGNPDFVNPAGGDFHIGPDSAAIDRGIDAGLVTDIDGDLRPMGAGYDIGADEYWPPLIVSKHAYPRRVQAGESLTYTIRVTNTSDMNLHATITDTLPTHVTLDQTAGGTLALPGGTVLLPGGAVAVTWTAVITAPSGVWTGTLRVTVDEGYRGPLTNLVAVTTKEGAVGEASVTVSTGRIIYLPMVMRNFPSFSRDHAPRSDRLERGG